MVDAVTVLPMDEHNQKLVDNVHPADWTNPTPPEKPYDMVVIGAGTAGLITAIAAAGFGKSVALIERHLMGGDCLNVGCVPSKALLRAAAVAAEVRHAGLFGIGGDGSLEEGSAGPDVDFGAVMERLRRLRAGIAPHDSAQRFSDAGVNVYLGSGTFSGPDSIEVGGATLRFKRACIATGARAGVPPIPGIEDVEILTNENLFELTEQPRRLGVVGGGAIGCEMSQAFARLGTEVHQVERNARLLPVEEEACAKVVQAALEKDGVQVHAASKDLAVSAVEGGIRMQGTASDGPYDVVVDKLLVAAGREPNTRGLGLEAAGVAYGPKGVQVDDRMRTTNKRIFAAGDIASKYQFTHAADAMARIVVRNALLGFLPFKPKASKLVVPWCTYTAPEIAHVGAYPRELEAAGTAFETVDIDLAGIDRAILESATQGRLHVHVKPNGTILGATLVSKHAGESIGELTTAMVHGIKLHQLASVIHPYPTQAEAIKRAADAWFKTRLLRMKDRILFWT